MGLSDPEADGWEVTEQAMEGRSVQPAEWAEVIEAPRGAASRLGGPCIHRLLK